MSDKDLFSRSLKVAGADVFKEGQASGAVLNRVGQLLSMLNEFDNTAIAPIAVDPGDYLQPGDDNNPGLSLALPIAYDVWYLWRTVNVIPDDETENKQFFNLILDDLFKKLGGVAPLRTILKSSLKPPAYTAARADQFIGIPNLSFFQTNGFYCIKEMRFETFLKDKAPKYASKGPQKTTEEGLNLEGQGVGDKYAGYTAFPVGALGVMEDIAFVCDSLLDSLFPEKTDPDGRYKALPGEQLFPPKDSLDVKLKGLQLYEKAYLNVCPDVEYPAEDMNATESIRPHNWMRLWLSKKNKWPIPGEFCGLTVKALAIPPHCWWFQETNPFAYSGNFFETDYYTSGIILAVISEVDRDKEAGTATYEVTALSTKHEQREGHGEHKLQEEEQFTLKHIGNVYKIRVKDQDLYLKSSDFLEYSIDERVAVRKIPGKREDNFTWNDLKPGRKIPGKSVTEKMDYDYDQAGKLFEINTIWSIVPITFYIDEE